MYQALYRKWRPKTFDEISGQEAVRTVLKRQVAQGHISHAYLFCGTRGTGKTSAAKILAKAVNCRNPEEGNPCTICDICEGIDDGSVLDIVEADAASNNGVANVRDIIEEVRYTPSTANRRVYIIDEVHMLSAGAFNALLKTLEEPPEHVIFILATTELHKVPATIISRCQVFEFTRIPTAEIVSRLKYIADIEKIDITGDGIEFIAGLSDGALRNALSILDQCAAGGTTITADYVAEISGLSGRGYLFDIARAVINRDGRAAMEAVEGALSRSKEVTIICGELISFYRDLMLISSIGSCADMLSAPFTEHGRQMELASSMNTGDIMWAIDRFSRAYDGIVKTNSKRVMLETAILALCNPMVDTGGHRLLARIERLEKALEKGGFPEVKAIETTRPAAAPQDMGGHADGLKSAGGDIGRTESPEAPVFTDEDAPPELGAVGETAEAPEAAKKRTRRQKADKSEGADGDKSEGAGQGGTTPSEIGGAAKALDPMSFWGDVVASVDKSLMQFLRTSDTRIEGDVLHLAPANEFAMTMLNKESARSQIEEYTKKFAGVELKVRVSMGAPVSARKKSDIKSDIFNRLAEDIEAMKK